MTLDPGVRAKLLTQYKTRLHNEQDAIRERYLAGGDVADMLRERSDRHPATAFSRQMRST